MADAIACVSSIQAVSHMIVRFCLLSPQDFMRKMRSKIRRYIYISTDSVYEVCQEPSHDGLTLEEDAVRPEDPSTREAYAKKDPYGSAKLDCK